MLAYRADIDGLRALAVLAVMAFHVGFAVPGGFIGVDVFFVISGYVITCVLQQPASGNFGAQLRYFYGRRAKRLLPALVVTLLASLVAGALILSPVQYERLASVVLSALGQYSNILFWKEAGYFDISSQSKPLLHTWSLSVEWQFYLLWPIAFLLLRRLLSRTQTMALLLLAIVLNAFFLVQFSGRTGVFYLPIFRLFEFAMGALCAISQRQINKPLYQEAATIVGMVAIVFPMTGWSNAQLDLWPSLLTLLPAVGTMLIIVAHNAPRAGWLLRNRAMVHLGVRSYALYLVHWPLYVFVSMVYGYEHGWQMQLVLLAASYGLAALLHTLVEKPWRYASYRSLWRRGVVACSVIALVAASLSIGVGEGWSWRVSEKERALFATIKHKNSEWQSDCHYNWGESSREEFLARWKQCRALHEENLVLIIGDSHARDMHHALAAGHHTQHFPGLHQIGCRIAKPEEQEGCDYDFVETVLAQHHKDITAIIYVQSGNSLIEGSEHQIKADRIKETRKMLEAIYRRHGVPIMWAGPHIETQHRLNEIGLNDVGPHGLNIPLQLHPAIHNVDRAIQHALKDSPLHYLSVYDIQLRQDPFALVHEGSFTYSDKDHWSVAGEALYGALLFEHSSMLREWFR